jgi:ubiquinone/menaquinone biosynthesis C-methylase UbiE
MKVNEKNVQNFWEANPCGESLITATSADWATFFNEYDAYRYSTEGHILQELDNLNNLNFDGKKILEVGIGEAADSEQIIRRGGHWSGLDLTDEAVFRAKKRFELKGIEYDEVKQGSALNIPYPDKAFDIVYSHGVLHHIPEIDKASREIFRVLKSDGQLVIMLYHKNSLNYRLSICLIRRFFLIGLSTIAMFGGERWIHSSLLKKHIENVRNEGLFRYLRNPRFLYANTDGPDNPYSKVYDQSLIEQDFPKFEIKSLRSHFLNQRHLPFLKIFPERMLAWLAAHYGWHMWVTLTPKIQ